MIKYGFFFNCQLKKYIKSKVSNNHDAEDILQDVFLKIYVNVEKLEDESKVKAWIYRITNNTIVDFYKKKRDVSKAPETFQNIEVEIEVPDNMNDEIVSCLKNMLFDLPEKYQKVYDLYENKEMKHRAIGEALDISEAASKVRLKRARDMFKTKLLSCCDFQVDQYGNIIDYKTKGTCKCSESCSDIALKREKNDDNL